MDYLCIKKGDKSIVINPQHIVTIEITKLTIKITMSDTTEHMMRQKDDGLRR